MVCYRRAPGVQHGGDADARAEMTPVNGDGKDGLRRRPEQQVLNMTALLWKAMSASSAGMLKTTWKYPTGSRSASRSASQVRAGGALALGAVPVAAAVIGDPLMATVLAGLDMTAHSRLCGTARSPT